MRAEKPNSDPRVWCCRWLPSSNGALNQDDMGRWIAIGVQSPLSERRFTKQVLPEELATRRQTRFMQDDLMSCAVTDR